MPINALGLGSLGIGLLNSYMGLTGLSSLHRQKMPTYKATPEFLASKVRADELARGGYSPAEKAAFEQSLSRSQNTGYQRAVDRAPGMAQEILSGVNYSNISAHNDFSARDASLHRENIRYSDQFSKYMQELNNRNVESQQRQRLLAEQSLGQAAQSGLSQIASGINLNQILNSDLYKDGNKTGVGTGITPSITGNNTAVPLTVDQQRMKLIEGLMKSSLSPQSGYDYQYEGKDFAPYNYNLPR